MAGLERLAGLIWPVYGGNFIKDPMGVRQGNELLAGLQRLAGLHFNEKKLKLWLA